MMKIFSFLMMIIFLVMPVTVFSKVTYNNGKFKRSAETKLFEGRSGLYHTVTKASEIDKIVYLCLYSENTTKTKILYNSVFEEKCQGKGDDRSCNTDFTGAITDGAGNDLRAELWSEDAIMKRISLINPTRRPRIKAYERAIYPGEARLSIIISMRPVEPKSSEIVFDNLAIKFDIQKENNDQKVPSFYSSEISQVEFCLPN